MTENLNKMIALVNENISKAKNSNSPINIHIKSDNVIIRQSLSSDSQIVISDGLYIEDGLLTIEVNEIINDIICEESEYLSFNIICNKTDIYIDFI